MVVIRLSRGGSKSRPFYNIVVADKRNRRDGRFIEQVGSWNPLLPKDGGERVKIDADRVKHWMDHGALPTDRVARFLDEACGGDEIGVRRLAADIPITGGDTAVMTTSDLVKHLAGGTWSKLMRSGRAVAARVDHDGERTVVIADRRPDRGAVSRIRIFGETRRP